MTNNSPRFQYVNPQFKLPDNCIETCRMVLHHLKHFSKNPKRENLSSRPSVINSSRPGIIKTNGYEFVLIGQGWFGVAFKIYYKGFSAILKISAGVAGWSTAEYTKYNSKNIDGWPAWVKFCIDTDNAWIPHKPEFYYAEQFKQHGMFAIMPEYEIGASIDKGAARYFHGYESKWFNGYGTAPDRGQEWLEPIAEYALVHNMRFDLHSGNLAVDTNNNNRFVILDPWVYRGEKGGF